MVEEVDEIIIDLASTVGEFVQPLQETNHKARLMGKRYWDLLNIGEPV